MYRFDFDQARRQRRVTERRRAAADRRRRLRRPLGHFDCPFCDAQDAGWPIFDEVELLGTPEVHRLFLQLAREHGIALDFEAHGDANGRPN